MGWTGKDRRVSGNRIACQEFWPAGKEVFVQFALQHPNNLAASQTQLVHCCIAFLSVYYYQDYREYGKLDSNKENQKTRKI
jgi:hypothetical protein